MRIFGSGFYDNLSKPSETPPFKVPGKPVFGGRQGVYSEQNGEEFACLDLSWEV